MARSKEIRIWIAKNWSQISPYNQRAAFTCRNLREIAHFDCEKMELFGTYMENLLSFWTQEKEATLAEPVYQRAKQRVLWSNASWRLLSTKSIYVRFHSTWLHFGVQQNIWIAESWRANSTNEASNFVKLPQKIVKTDRFW